MDGADRNPDLRYATAGELDRRADALSEQVNEGFQRVTEDIRSTRHGLNETLQKLTLTVGLQGRDIGDILNRERAAKEERQRLIGWVIAISGIVSAAFWAAANFVKGWGRP